MRRSGAVVDLGSSSSAALGLTLGLLLALVHPAAAQRAMPESAPLTNFNPLCDSSLVQCLEIDDFAGHLHGHLQVLPKTERRDIGVVFPFGVTLGLFGRLAGGISSSYSFWTEDGSLYKQLGPLRLNLTARLWPLFPLRTSRTLQGAETAESSGARTRRFQFGLSYEHQLRVGPFSGANSLGLLKDLAAIYLIGSKQLGPFQFSVSLGSQYDWSGSFAFGVIAAQVGLYLPFFEALKVYVEGMGRGFPAYVSIDAMLRGSAGQQPVQAQGMVGGGLTFSQHGRVDLGISVHRGFRGIAPWVVGVHFLVISAGQKYEGRAVTPIAQMAADATAEVASALHTYIKSLPIDPMLDERCMLLDDNGDLLAEQPLGTRTADGKCMVQGEKLPIGETWWRDRKKSVICRDKSLTDCLMYRRPQARIYRALHRPWVGDDCVLRENVYDLSSDGKVETQRAVELAVIGTATRDRTGCTDPSGYVHAVGTRYYREHGHLWVCDAPKIEEQRERCFMALPELPQKMQSQVTPIGRIARALDRGLGRKAQSIDGIPAQVVDIADDVAEERLTVATVAGALKAKAVYIAEHASLNAAKRWFHDKLDGVKNWAHKPHIEQGEDVAMESGDALLPHPVMVGATIVTGGLGRGVNAVRVADELEDAARIGQKVFKKAGLEAARARTAAETSGVLLRNQQQLQAKFKHAIDFGVSGNYSKARAAEFSQAIHKHINSPTVRPIVGTYHKKPVTHYLDPLSGLNVIADPAGNFISGWRLNPVQLQNVVKHGGL